MTIKFFDRFDNSNKYTESSSNSNTTGDSDYFAESKLFHLLYQQHQLTGSLKSIIEARLGYTDPKVALLTFLASDLLSAIENATDYTPVTNLIKGKYKHGR